MAVVYSDEWGSSGCSGLAHGWVLETLRGTPVTAAGSHAHAGSRR